MKPLTIPMTVSAPPAGYRCCVSSKPSLGVDVVGRAIAGFPQDPKS